MPHPKIGPEPTNTTSKDQAEVNRTKEHHRNNDKLNLE
jgi:hypothetical protein